ncbi:hypothetical protein EV127DRAFT_450044 [Xylaria flabelliformis]|nr:hypothetical protein EV127DRAFT_450044 [Xylaria flabelliformis]
MTRQRHICPFITGVFDQVHDAPDVWPASYHGYETSSETGSGRKRRIVADPTKAVKKFLKADLSFTDLSKMSKYLWLAGLRGPPAQLHSQIFMGRQIIVSERMDHHLVCGSGSLIFLRPIPAFLLDPRVWQNDLACPPECGCQRNNVSGGQSCMKDCREIARGFLYTYRGLVASEADFFIANEHRLLPRGPNGDEITWPKWKIVVRELVASYDQSQIHSRFQLGELSLQRLDMIHYYTCVPLLTPYIRDWRGYGITIRNNLTFLTSVTVFIALVLTAMQVGLATDRLKDNTAFQQASYGFTIFAILGPIGLYILLEIGIFVLLLLVVVYGLVKDIGDRARGGSNSQPGDI